MLLDAFFQRIENSVAATPSSHLVLHLYRVDASQSHSAQKVWYGQIFQNSPLGAFKFLSLGKRSRPFDHSMDV
jgi:hypothetical protein